MEIKLTKKGVKQFVMNPRNIKLFFKDGESIVLPVKDITIDHNDSVSTIHFCVNGICPLLIKQRTRRIHITNIHLTGEGYDLLIDNSSFLSAINIFCDLRIAELNINMDSEDAGCTDVYLTGDIY